MDFFSSQIVKSIAGHDKGSLYHVFLVTDEYVSLIDGKIRRTENPKLKKNKHLTPMGEIISPCAEKLKIGVSPTNRDVIKSLAAFRAGRAFLEGGK